MDICWFHRTWHLSSKHVSLPSRLLDSIQQRLPLRRILDLIHASRQRRSIGLICRFYIKDAFSTCLRIPLRILQVNLNVIAIVFNFTIVGYVGLGCVSVLIQYFLLNFALFPSCLSCLLKQALRSSARLVVARVERSYFHLAGAAAVRWGQSVHGAIRSWKLEVPIACNQMLGLIAA